MKPAPSIHLTWPLAAQEAILGEFEYIEPCHIFLAALKFAELEEKQIQAVADSAGMAKDLITEQGTLLSLLHARSISVPNVSRTIRRGLRKHIGKGGCPHDGRRVIHRSKATLDLFKRAEQAAGQANEPHLTTCHLLQVLLESPPKEVQAILSLTGIRLDKPQPYMPTIAKFGRELGTQGFSIENQPPVGKHGDIMNDPVCKVIFDSLSNQSKKGVLLIQKGKRTPEEAAVDLAVYLKKSPGPLERVIEIDFTAEHWMAIIERHRDMENTIGTIFDEAVQSADLVLFFKNLSVLFASAEAGKRTALIRERMRTGAPCIAGTDENGYRSYFDKDREWEKVLQPVWIHDLDLPLRL